VCLCLYTPVAFPVNLFKFKALVDDGVVAFGSPVTREANPYLVVKHPPQQKWEYEKVGKVPFTLIFGYK
jgi:hypothetical protein